MTLTAGVALFPVDGNDFEELAREAGRGRVDAGPLARGAAGRAPVPG